MKMVSNVLLAAAVISSPALADDVSLHEMPVAGDTVVHSVQQTVDNNAYFSPAAEMLDWEAFEMNELIEGGKIQTPEDYRLIRLDRHRLFNAPAQEVANELISIAQGGEGSLSFSSAYYNDDMLSLMDSEQLLDIVGEFYTQLDEQASMSTTSISGDVGYYMSHIQEVLTERGVNSVAHFDAKGDVVSRDALASKLLNFDYKGYDMDSGMVDFQTQQPVSVGKVLFEGCLCNNPLEPGELTVIMSDYSPEDIRLTELTQVVDKGLAASYDSVGLNQRVHSHRADGSSFYIGIKGDTEGGHDFIYLNKKTADSRIRLVEESNNVPDALKDDVKGFYVNDLVHHEVQHSRTFQEQHREGAPERVREARSHYRANQAEYTASISEVSAQVLFSTRMFSEMNSDIYAATKGMQQWLQHIDMAPEKQMDFTDAVSALATEKEQYHNHFDAEVLEETFGYKAHLFKSEAELNALDLTPDHVSELLRLSAQLEGASQERIDEAFNLMTYHIKNPYQSSHGVAEVRDMIEKDVDAFIAMSEAQLQSKITDMTFSLLETPEYQAFVQNPQAYEVGDLSLSSTLEIAHDGEALATTTASPAAVHHHSHEHDHDGFEL